MASYQKQYWRNNSNGVGENNGGALNNGISKRYR